MKQQDTVFLLTLIDFLFQIIFFGLFAYAIYAATSGKSQLEKKINDYRISGDVLAGMLPNSFDSLKKILGSVDSEGADEMIIKELNRQGYASLVELTDDLSKLAPIKELSSLDQAAKELDNEKQVLELSKLAKKSGGYMQAKVILEKYIASGVGKPHCYPVTDESGKVVGAKALATVVALDNSIKFKAETPQLSNLLSKLGLKFSDVSILTPSAFSRVFRNVGRLYPDCVHKLDFIEKTRLVDARDAAGQMFRLKLIKQ